MQIMRCSEGEAAQLSAIHIACFDTGWNTASVAALFDTPGTYALGCEHGMILCRVAGEQADLITLAVLPEARKQGVATALLHAALNEAARRGAEALFLEVAEGNVAARKLYENAGFSIVSRRRAYYGNGEDALLMSKSLT